MSEPSQSVGIVGTGIVAQQIAESLMERAYPYSSIRFFGEGDSVGEELSVASESFEVEALAESLGRLDVVFLTREAACSERIVETFLLAGGAVIDCSGRYAREPEVPLVVPECNPEAIAASDERGIIACPDPAAVALSIVLGPLHAQAGIRRVVATSLEPVSEAGAPGVEELSRQTVELLQGRGTDADVFPARICFNVVPFVGDLAPSGNSFAEEQTVWQVRRVLEQPELAISVNRLLVPLFFGIGMTVDVELETPMDAAEAIELLRGAPGILVTSGSGEQEVGSIADAVGQDATVVSRVRADRSAEHGLSFWLALDNTRKGSAVNAVQIAELLLKS